MPCKSNESARTWFAASEGWTPSQNTYWVALGQAPGDFGLHKQIVFPTVPTRQQPLLASTKPIEHHKKG